MKPYNPWPAGGDWQDNILALAATGAEAYRLRKVGCIRFDLFNAFEVAEMRAVMALRYPDVPYFTTQITAGPKDR